MVKSALQIKADTAGLEAAFKGGHRRQADESRAYLRKGGPESGKGELRHSGK